MVKVLRSILALVLATCVLFAAGCRQGSSPPSALALTEIPGQIQKAFATAAPGAREIAKQVSDAVRVKDYPAAYEGVQILASLHDATPEQRSVAARSLLGVVGVLKELQAKGDPAATAALQAHRASK